MGRSSRHKSSKHRDGRDYSDSDRDRDRERESRRSGNEKSVSGEKRSKDFVEEYGSSSSKKRREDEAGGSRKPASSSSRRREETSVGGGKVKDKDKELVEKVRREGRVDGDGDRDRDRKGFGDNEPNRLDNLQSPEADNQSGRRNKKKRDGYDNAEKHQYDEFENKDRRLSSREIRQKDEKHKDEKYGEKYREDAGRDVVHGDGKKRDANAGVDYTSRRYYEKLTRDDYEALEVRQRDRGRGRNRDREYALDGDHHNDVDIYRERDRVRNRSRSHDNDHDYDWEWEHNQDKARDNDRKVHHNRDIDRDHDGSHLDDKSTRYKDRRGKKRSPDDRDDFDDNAPVKLRYSDREKRLMKSGRVEQDAERGRSQLRQPHSETAMTSNRRRNSPISDEHRHFNSEDIRYRDPGLEDRPKSRDASDYFGASERGSKYRSMEKSVKMDDGRLREPSSERSTLKASSIVLAERSPSANAERRYINRTGPRRSLDVEASMRRGGAFDGRDYSANEDRFSRDLAAEKPPVDESSQTDLAFYGRTSQGHPSLNAQPLAFRTAVDSPRGSLDEDGRVRNSARYRRSSDPNIGRGPGNAWRGVPNWPSPAPNGFLPFQHGPPHGGFQNMIPQYPAPPMYGVRTPVDGHSGFPYHLSDAERFPGHMRPVGWQNMMDGSGPPHLHGWEGNNGMFRDEAHIYGGPEWDQNRQSVNGRGRESGTDPLKGQTDEANRELPSISHKNVTALGSQVESSVGQASQKSEHEKSQDGIHAKTVGLSSSGFPVKEASEFSPQVPGEKESHPSKPSSHDDAGRYSRVYLSKLDISKELADPELYGKCIDLVDVEQSTTSFKEPDAVVHKDMILIGEKTSTCLTGPSLSNPVKDNLFQSALNLYKISVESRGLLLKKLSVVDTYFSAPDKGTLENRVSGHDVDKVEKPLIFYEEDMPVSHVPTLDQYDTLAVSDDTFQNEAQSTQIPIQGLAISAGSRDSQPNAEGIKGDGKHSILPSDGEDTEGTCETKSNPSACGAEEMQDVGEAMGALFYSDGSPKAFEALMPESNESESSKACEALMPESNKSESVIIQRIHHFPESTH